MRRLIMILAAVLGSMMLALCLSRTAFAIGPEVVTPTPVPTAQSATQAQLSAFMAFAPSPPPKGSWAINESAVAGPWALVGFCNDYSGMTGLLQLNSSGLWTVVVLGGGQLTVNDLEHYAPSMPAPTAQSLFRLASSQNHGCSGRARNSS
jgi:hypothetical protein